MSEKTDDALKKILESKKRWSKEIEDFQHRTREGGSPVVKLGSQSDSGKSEGKVFVRADLNYPSGKR